MNLDGKIIDQQAMTARLIVHDHGPTLPELPANAIFDRFAAQIFTPGATMSPAFYERYWQRLMREQGPALARMLREFPGAKMGGG